jgi:hypothetical protein
MNFQPLGLSGTTELSDDQRYMITRAWDTDRWDVWLQMTEGPNVRLAKNLDKAAARSFCENHHTQLNSETTGAPAQC